MTRREGAGSKVRCACATSAAVAVALVVTACGGTSDQDQVRAALDRLQAAFAANDYDELCAVTTRATHRQADAIGHKYTLTDDDLPPGCRGAMLKFVRMAKGDKGHRTPAPPKAVAVALSGGRATATVRLGDHAVTRIPFVKVGGKWKADALYGGIPAALQKDKY